MIENPYADILNEPDNGVFSDSSPIEIALAEEGITGEKADIARSIYHQESSSGKNTKTSNAGAVGGMQINPATFKANADKGWSIKDPVHNARAAVRYIDKLYKKSGGDAKATAAGYYGGEGAMVLAKKGIARKDKLNPSAPDTLQYANQVVARLPAQAALANASISDNPYADILEMPDSPPVKPDSAPVKQEPSTASKVESTLNEAAFGLPVGTLGRSMLHNIGKFGTGAVELGAEIGSSAVEGAVNLFGGEEGRKTVDLANRIYPVRNQVAAENMANEAQYQKEVPDSAASYAGAIAGNILPFMFNPVKSGMDAAFNVPKSKIAGMLSNSPRLGEFLGNVAGGASAGAAITPFMPVNTEGNYMAEKANQLGTNMLAGGVISPLIPALTGTASYVGDRFRGVTDLFKGKQGARNIAENYVKTIAGKGNNPSIASALNNADEIVTGSAPTASEAISMLPEGSPIQAHQNIVAQEPFGVSARFGERALQQQSARQSALSWAGTEDDIARLVQERTDAVEPLYKAVEKSTAKVKSSPVLTKVNEIYNKNANKDSITVPLSIIRNDLVKKTTGEIVSPYLGIERKGTITSIESNPQKLKSISDNISDMMGKKTVDGKNEYDVKVLTEIKELLDEQIGKSVPDYAKAMALFREKSVPINQLKIGQNLRDKLTNPIGNETPGSYMRTLSNEKKLLKDSIGFGRTSVDDILTPEQLQSINAVARDLERTVSSANPAQKTNLRGGINVANETTVSLPQLLSRPAMVTNYILKSLGKNIEPEVDSYFAQLYLNPKQLSAVLAKVEPSKRAAVNSALQTFGRAYIASGQLEDKK